MGLTGFLRGQRPQLRKPCIVDTGSAVHHDVKWFVSIHRINRR